MSIDTTPSIVLIKAMVYGDEGNEGNEEIMGDEELAKLDPMYRKKEERLVDNENEDEDPMYEDLDDSLRMIVDVNVESDPEFPPDLDDDEPDYSPVVSPNMTVSDSSSSSPIMSDLFMCHVNEDEYSLPPPSPMLESKENEDI